MDKTLTLDYTIKPISYELINPQFAKMRCWVMALGKNRNYSYFSKEAVQQALYSIYNIPVVAHIKKKEDGTGWYVGSHDRQIVIDDDGIEVNDLTIPLGIVPESCNPEFVEVIESNGSKAIYLAVDILLWVGRYPKILEAKSASDNDVYYNESMEISVSAYKELSEDNRYSNIIEFIFSALTLLGRDKENPEYHSEPCFPSSRVEPIQYCLGDKFKKEFSIMLTELNKLSFIFDKNQSSNTEVDINTSFSKEKEERNLDEKKELISKYNLTIEQLDFNIDEISLEDLETKLKEFVEANKEPEKETRLGFSATYNQKREALRNALDSEIIRDSDNNIVEETYYWVADASDEFVFVEKSHWTANGDYENKYGRFTYSFDETTMTATITSDFEEMFLMWLTAEQKAEIDSMNANYSQMKSEFDEYKNTYKTAETEVETLRNFQSQRLEQDRKEAEAAIFSEFDEELADVDEYKAIKDNSSKYELETLKEKCFAILGKSKRTFSFSKKSEKSSVILGVDRVSTEDDPYGGLIKSVNK